MSLIRIFSVSSFAVLLFCLLPSPASAQQYVEQEFRFGALGLEDGLSQGMIYCILQDKKGFLWFGTKEGLNRYDGYRFTIYRNIPGDSTSLADNQVYSMAEDGAGRIWVGTRTRGLQLFDPVTEVFTPFPLAKTNSKISVDEPVHHLVVDAEGYLWIGGLRSLLARLDTRHGSVYRLRKSCTIFTGDPRFHSSDAFGISRTSTGLPAILIDEGVWSYGESGHGFERVLDWRSMGLPIGDGNFEIIHGTADRKGRFWLSANLAGRFVVLRIDMRSKSITDTLRFAYDGAELVARSIVIGSDDILYCSGSYYLVRCDLRQRTYSVTPQVPAQEGRLHGSVANLLFDRSGNLWIGTSGLGLHTFNPNTLAFHADIRPLKHALFGKELRIFEESIKQEHGRSKRLLTTIYPIRGADNSVWCGTVNYGLLHYDPVSGRVRRYGYAAKDPYNFLMLRLSVPFFDSKGNVWIGNPQGVSRLVDRPEQWEHFFYTSGEPDLTNREDNVNCFHEDRDGSLWLGTLSRGLAHLDPAAKTFRIFTYVLSDTTSISSDHVLAITADPSKPERYLWIGTDGGGLNRFDKRTGKFRRFDLRHGLPNMVIYGILPDSTGMLWMSSNNGLIRMDPATMQFTNFHIRDGLQDNEFNRTESYSIPPLLYFGGVKGHNSFNPREIRRNLTVPQIVLTGLRLFNEPVTNRSILPVAVPYATTITLAHDQNMLTFEFSALDYSAPTMNRYRYKMEGLDRQWIEAGAARSATYTYLRPGEYTFRVVGSNNHGVWNTQGASLRITVRPPWWRTFWAYASYGIVVMLAMFGVDRIQRRRVIARERVLAHTREAVLRAEAAEMEARAVRAENERNERDLRIAADMQKRILPQALPEIPGYTIAATNLPAHEIGGDYYDCIPLGDERYALVIADVAGKGLPSALLVNSLHASLLVQLDAVDPLENLVLRLNELIYRISTPSTFITFIIAILHAPSGRIEMINAGHNPAIVHTVEGGIELMKEHGLPLGCSIDIARYASECRVLLPGEGLLLYTDGIPEAMNGAMEQFGQEALENFLASRPGWIPCELLDALIGCLTGHRGNARQSDDLTMLFIRRNGFDPSPLADSGKRL